jgi:RNA polymerase sigma-70 factor, ECF subfamily
MLPDVTNPQHHQLIAHLTGLFGYAMALTRSRENAEDLLQETYVRAFAAVGRVRAKSNIKAWLFTILRNIWRNEIRSRVSRPRHEPLDGAYASSEVPADLSQNPHMLYVALADRRRVLAAIDQLPSDAREIIILREFEELSYQQIADILKCPLGTVMSRLDRARTKLRMLLRDI